MDNYNAGDFNGPMSIRPIDIPDSYVPADFVVFYQLEADALHIISDSGSASIACKRPKLLMRDLLSGKLKTVTPHEVYGVWPLDYFVTEAIFSSRAPRCVAGVEIPDGAPLLPGQILIETTDCATYHPVTSVQFIGLRGQYLYVALASHNYRATVDHGQGPEIFSALRTRLKKAHGFHMSSFAPTDFVSWTSVRRSYVNELKFLSELPTNLGDMDAFLDFRQEPAHAEFKSRVDKGRKNVAREFAPDL